MDMKCLIFELMVMPAASLSLFKKEKFPTVILLVDDPMLVPPTFGNKFIAYRHIVPVFWEFFFEKGEAKCPLLC
jgi:hypothetical protein